MAGKVGTVTVATTGGAVVGYAAAAIIVWALAQFGIDAEPIQDALSVVLLAAAGIFGGKLVPGGGNGRRVANGD